MRLRFSGSDKRVIELACKMFGVDVGDPEAVRRLVISCVISVGDLALAHQLCDEMNAAEARGEVGGKLN